MHEGDAMKIDAKYGITTRLPSTDLVAARQRITSALANEGFGVLTEIDMKKTLKAKLDVDIDPYVVLGACNPKLASRALAIDPGVGLLLPCNVVLTEDGPDVVVSVASPRSLFGIVGDSVDLRPIADEAEERLQRVVAAL
jgi:uncharacterized protein (DUF302 family)